MPEIAAGLLYKGVGAIAGAILALVFIPPRSWPGFFQRATAALIFGVMFAQPARYWLGFEPSDEGIASAACAAAFVSWWAMGTIKRVVDAWQRPKDE